MNSSGLLSLPMKDCCGDGQGRSVLFGRSHRIVDQCYRLQWCYEVSTGNSLPTFRRILLFVFQAFSFHCTVLLGSFRPLLYASLPFFSSRVIHRGHSSTAHILNLWIITPKGAQIAQYRSPRRLYFVRCLLIFVSPLYGTGVVSPSWRLEFWSGCYVFEIFVYPWTNLNCMYNFSSHLILMTLRLHYVLLKFKLYG